MEKQESVPTVKFCFDKLDNFFNTNSEERIEKDEAKKIFNYLKLLFTEDEVAPCASDGKKPKY